MKNNKKNYKKKSKNYKILSNIDNRNMMKNYNVKKKVLMNKKERYQP